MSRIFFDRELDTAAAWWRIYRADGVTLGFTTHDRDLRFDGILHRAAPGMLPSAIRKTIGFADDESEVTGAISHSAISEGDLASGRFDGARVESGIVDWETLEAAILHGGSIGAVSQDRGSFSAQMRSVKADLEVDPVPLSSPTCRAQFCGPECALNPVAFETVALVTGFNADRNALSVDRPDLALYIHGKLRFLEGALSGLATRVLSAGADQLIVDRPFDDMVSVGHRVRLRQGCDRTIATCSARFGNARNFRGEPFLPGNDMLAQYPMPR